MTEEKLQKANDLSIEITNTESSLKGIKKAILNVTNNRDNTPFIGRDEINLNLKGDTWVSTPKLIDFLNKEKADKTEALEKLKKEFEEL